MTTSGSPAAPAGPNGPVLGSPILRVLGETPFCLDGELLALAFAADGTAWSVEEGGVLRQWDLAGGLRRKHALSDLEFLWAFSPNATLVASASDELCLWATASGQLLGTFGEFEESSWVTAQAFRPDNRLLATGHDDGSVRLWSFAGGEQHGRFEAHDRPISCLAFSRDGRRLAVASEDKTISIWDALSARRVGLLPGHTDRVAALAWHPYRAELVSAGWDGMARVWNVDTLEPVILLNAHEELVSALAFSPDGRLLACADNNHVVWIWDADAHRPLHLLGGHAEGISALAFHPDGKWLLSGGRERRLMLWNVSADDLLKEAGGRRNDEKRAGDSSSSFILPPSSFRVGQPVAQFPQSVDVARISPHPDGRRLACVSGGPAVQVWDALEARRLFQIDQPDAQALCFSPDGEWLATGDAAGRVHLWSVEQRHQRQPFQTHGGGITSLDFSLDGRLLAAGNGTGGCVYLWSVPDFEPVLLIPEATERGTVEAVRFVPGSSMLAVAGLNWLSGADPEGVVCLWDFAGRRKLISFECDATRLAARPDGAQLAANTGDGTICFWDLKRLRLSSERIDHGSTIRGLAYDPTGRFLASAGDDGVVRLWRAESGTPAGSLDRDTPIKDLAISSDGRLLFTANSNLTCYVVDVRHIVEG